ncbi:hypothetical protein CCY01nite_17910 [Chitinophaga cymbidii]|uniref:Uncharacterized protein n=1 Tax=Chitinophaga cymbidii TaxID=1096750 RepID=A0A512RIK0_9BACT|nr:hypothetical protein CCY01nite_17910 [Chitinophaga cymbidii]
MRPAFKYQPPGTVLHEKFERLLHHLTLRNDQLIYLKKAATCKLKKALNINARLLMEQHQMKREVMGNIEKLENDLSQGKYR